MQELNIEDWLTERGLKTYRRNRENYLQLCDNKARIINTLSGLKSTDFQKDKVTSGNRRRPSQQEILAIRLEDLNKQLEMFEGLFYTLEPEILKQIGKLTDFDERKALQLFYLDAQTTNACTMYFFGENPDINENWDLYVQKFKALKRQAIKDFLKFSKVKYVIVEQKTFC